MDITNSSTNGTQISTASRGSFYSLILKFLLFVISFPLFWVGISLAILIHLIIRYIFRLKESDSVPKFRDESETEETYEIERFTGFDYIFENNHDLFLNNNDKNHDFLLNNIEKQNSYDFTGQEKLAKHGLKQDKEFEALEPNEKKLEPTFSFKFEYQMPEKDKEEKISNLDELTIRTEVSNEKPVSANIQNYQIVSEKNLKGFVEPPETLRVSVKESHTGTKFEKFYTKEKNFEFKLDKEIFGSIEKVKRGTEPEPNLKFVPKPKFENFDTTEKNLESKSDKELIGSIQKVQRETEPEPNSKIKRKPKVKKIDNGKKNVVFKLDKEIIGSIEMKVQSEKEEPNLKKESKPKCEIQLEKESEAEMKSKYEFEPKPKFELKPKFKLEPEPKPQFESESVRLNFEEKDTDMISKNNLSDEFDRESWCENEPQYMDHEETNKEFKQKSPKNSDSFGPINQLEEFENSQFETETPLVKPRRISTSSPSTVSSHERYKARRKIISEEFSGFDSDSDYSLSDGYSVKDLVVDSDNDWSLSEKETSNHAREFYSVVNYNVTLMDDIRNMDESKDHFEYIHDQRDEVEVWSVNSLKNEFEERKLEEDNNSEEFDGVNETKMEEDDNLEELEGVNEIKLEETDNLEEFEGVDKIKFEENNNLEEYEGVNEIELEENNNLEEYEGVNEIELEEYNNLEEFEGVNGTNSETKISLDMDINFHNEAYLDSLKEKSVPMKEKSVPMYEEFLDRETNINSSKYENNNPPLEILDIEKPSEPPQKIENNFRNKGKEYLEEEFEEENDELESLWEHQDLIEQLKMEIKKAKAIGLPTILEESETPKTTIEDLKPFRFDEKFLREDPMDELHKFYRSYRERMRKFDILNYQKMYAVGFLHLKDPLESMGSQKPTITSILSQNLIKRRKSTDDPSEQFIRELRCDLETVYVGQMCLSWEFLRWQYEKSCEMTESDPFRSHSYNQSAGEFQQFQVLIGRFVENEPFQGNRLPNYVKNRCVLRNLIQVPIIKEDSLKEKSEEQKKGNYTITSEELEDIMEESIRVFWEFVKADKDETPGILKGLMGPQVELQDPSDYSFMMKLHSILQKKEKRLKDLLRTGNCIVKKFKKPKEDRSNQDLFFSHVDIKLVSRVLKMPRITSEQLQWCHKKLEKISFVDRKIQREPSFLLFPC